MKSSLLLIILFISLSIAFPSSYLSFFSLILLFLSVRLVSNAYKYFLLLGGLCAISLAKDDSESSDFRSLSILSLIVDELLIFDCYFLGMGS